MTNDSRRFGFTYGYDDAVTAAMQERTYQWMDIVFVDFGEISGDCLLRKSRPAIVLSGTEYNESSPILTVAPMTRSLKGLDSKYHVFIDREDCNNELNTSGMCMLEHCQAIDRRQIKHKNLQRIGISFTAYGLCGRGVKIMFQYDGLVVGQRIRNLRIEAGYGLGEFSDELGKSESHIKQVELGSRKISLDLLISLMEVLHVDANSILGESSDHKDNSIDAKLQELPEPQRQYFTAVFLIMMANYPATA